MKQKLKPCPFCGSTNIELDHTGISVFCGDCAAEGPFGDADMEYAIEAWNNRAEPVMPPVLHAQILTLRKYQAWRTGEYERTMDEAGIVPSAITSALDGVLDYASEKLKAQDQPIAKVTGWYGGHLVIEPTNRAVTLPVGMALYAASQTTKES